MKVARSHICRGFHAEGDPEPGRCDWYSRKAQGIVFVRCTLPHGHEGNHRPARGDAAAEAAIARLGALSGLSLPHGPRADGGAD